MKKKKKIYIYTQLYSHVKNVTTLSKKKQFLRAFQLVMAVPNSWMVFRLKSHLEMDDD